MSITRMVLPSRCNFSKETGELQLLAGFSTTSFAGYTTTWSTGRRGTPTILLARPQSSLSLGGEQLKSMGIGPRQQDCDHLSVHSGPMYIATMHNHVQHGGHTRLLWVTHSMSIANLDKNQQVVGHCVRALQES